MIITIDKAYKNKPLMYCETYMKSTIRIVEYAKETLFWSKIRAKIAKMWNGFHYVTKSYEKLHRITMGK